MVISYYGHCVSVALKHAQAIPILQRAVTLWRGSLSLLHIATKGAPRH